MSGFRSLLNPDFLRLANKITYDHGRGPLTVGGPGSLNLLNPLLLRHCARLIAEHMYSSAQALVHYSCHDN